MSAPLELKCHSCGGNLPQASFGQRYVRCPFCATSYDTGPPPSVPITPFGAGGPYGPSANPFPPAAPPSSGARVAMYVAPFAFVMISLLASGIAQCGAQRRAEDASAAAAAQAEAQRQQRARDQLSAERPTSPAVATAPPVKPVAVAYKIGDKVTVDWKGSPYAATILAVVGSPAAGPASLHYKIHYDGWGKQFDETIDAAHVLGKR